MIRLLFTGLLLLYMLPLSAQTDSILLQTKPKPTFLKQSIVPVSLIVGGSLISGSGFEKSFQREVRKTVGHNFSFHIDDYSRYVPMVEMYAADAFGVKAKNHWFDQAKNLTLSILITDFITFKLKKNIHKIRPHGGTDAESFPSGHTSFAFANASVLFEEFKDSSPLLAYSGYAFATTTGSFRIMNNAHWISDVLVSAGIGILVTKIIYAFDPIIVWNPFKKIEGVSFIPAVNANQYGFYLSKTF